MKRVFTLYFFILIALSVFAVPAFPDLISFRQPGMDFSVNIFLKGDERVHWAETEDGYSLLHRDDGCFVYAMRDPTGDMVPSPLLAHNKDQRTDEEVRFLADIPLHLRFSQQQVDAMLQIWKMVEDAKQGPKAMTDVTGEKKFLVILFGFSDQSFSYGRFTFRQLFNQVNYSAHGMTGSVHDYYYDASKGLFSLSVDVVGPFIGANPTAYYGATDYGSQAFAREAVDSAANYVDFSDYDNDGDGFIDGLHIIFAGYGEEAGASSDCIWSHKWNIFDAPTYNNTVVDVYSCSPELGGSYGTNLTNIGVICHELGHVFGAPDYYDTDYAGSGGEFPGLGRWDIMSGGSWNRNGQTPANHNPYTKLYIYHWADCDTIDDTPAHYILRPASETNNDVIRINTSTEGDFFLIENRQRIKWDEAIPGHGMLVYHVHPDAQGAWVSNYAHPQQIYILSPSQYQYPNSNPASYGNLNSSDTPYPGGGARDSLTDFTTPWMRPWSGVPTNIPISSISENSADNTIIFSVNKSPENFNVGIMPVSQHSVLLDWQRYGGYSTFVVMSTHPDSIGIPARTYHVGDTIDGGGVVVYKGNDDYCLVDSLEREQTYYFKVFSLHRNRIYSEGVLLATQTLSCPDEYWTSENFDATTPGQLPPCWSGSWSASEAQQGNVLGLSNPDPERWLSVVSRPIFADSLRNAVLSFRLHYDENSDMQASFRLRYRRGVASHWDTLLLDTFALGMANWREVYVALPELGDFSQIEFSAKSAAPVAVDDLVITDGMLVQAVSNGFGSITPSGYLTLNVGDSVTFSIAPYTGNTFANLLLDNDTIPLDSLQGDTTATLFFTLAGDNKSHVVFAEFSAPVAIQNATDDQPLVVYPNPTTGTLFIQAAPGTTLTLFDISGRLLLQQCATASTTSIPVDLLRPGIYLLRANSQVYKIVKQ